MAAARSYFTAASPKTQFGVSVSSGVVLEYRTPGDRRPATASSTARKPRESSPASTPQLAPEASAVRPQTVPRDKRRRAAADDDDDTPQRLRFSCPKRRVPVVLRALRRLAMDEAARVYGSGVSPDASLIWTDAAVSISSVRTLHRHQRINRFPGLASAISKRSLAKTLGRLQLLQPAVYDFFPPSFNLPAESPGCIRFLDANPESVVIVKPHGGSCGRGIFLCADAAVIAKLHGHVAQQYIARPLLVDGLKWDLRVYVALTSVDPLRVLVYREGLARFATHEYEAPHAGNIDDMFVHLTNYTVNKYSDEFIGSSDDEAAEAAHGGDSWSHATKRPMTTIFDQLEVLGHNVDSLWWRIKALIAKTMHALHPALAQQYRAALPRDVPAGAACFQLLGFDVMVDEDLRPWLLEINNNPSLSCERAVDWELKEGLLANLFTLLSLEGPSTSRRVPSAWASRSAAERTAEDSLLGNFERVCPPSAPELADFGHRSPFDAPALWRAYSESCWRKHADTEHAMSAQNLKKLLRAAGLVTARGYTAMDADLLFMQCAKDEPDGATRLSFSGFCDALLDIADRMHPELALDEALADVVRRVAAVGGEEGDFDFCCGPRVSL